MLALLGCVTGFAYRANAQTIIDKSQAVAPNRTDAGNGLCGNSTHYAQPQLPLTKAADAVMLLELPMGDSRIIGRIERSFGNINFRNGQLPGSVGEFVPPMYTKDVFPFSLDPSADPMGTLQNGGDINFALRLRGYYNVPTTVVGKVIDFGVNCDDFCSLTIGTKQVMMADERTGARIIRQVTFTDPGLYPIELLYYQNGSLAYLEWSRTSTPIAECQNDICNTPLTDPMYKGAFSIVARDELYTSIADANAPCQECGAASMPPCSAGDFCGNGLCQPCTVSAHCGMSCQACPADASECLDGNCVIPCILNKECPSGQLCDPVTHTCTGCMTNRDCPPPLVCDPGTERCIARVSPESASGCRIHGSSSERPQGKRWLPWAALLAFGLWRLRRGAAGRDPRVG